MSQCKQDDLYPEMIKVLHKLVLRPYDKLAHEKAKDILRKDSNVVLNLKR